MTVHMGADVPDQSRARPTHRYNLSVALTVVVLAILARFLRVGVIENDHYAYLSLAHQVLHGDWPVRDFFDPGMPLSYMVSAAAAAVFGPNLLAEAFTSVILFASGVLALYLCALRALNSAPAAFLLVLCVIAFPPRLYGSSKVFVPMVGTLLAWRYADTRQTGNLAILGAWTGVAFLFRHDYTLLVGSAAVGLVAAMYWSSWRLLQRNLLVLFAGAAGVAAPWLVYVEVHQGLGAYFASAFRYSIAEANRTVHAWPFVFYAVALVPAVMLYIGRSGTRTLAREHVLFLGVLLFMSDIVFLRDDPVARLPDALPATVLGLAVVVSAWLQRDALERLVKIGVLTSCIGAIAAGVVVASRFGVPDLPQRWRLISERLLEARPEIMPTPEDATLVRYIRRCVGVDARVLVVGFAPEMSVLSRRAFAGGRPYWSGGYYQHPSDIARARAQLAREQVGIVLFFDSEDAFRRNWPALTADLQARGLQSYSVRLPSRSVDVWLPIMTSPIDSVTGLPCHA